MGRSRDLGRLPGSRRVLSSQERRPAGNGGLVVAGSRRHDRAPVRAARGTGGVRPARRARNGGAGGERRRAAGSGAAEGRQRGRQAAARRHHGHGRQRALEAAAPARADAAAPPADAAAPPARAAGGRHGRRAVEPAAAGRRADAAARPAPGGTAAAARPAPAAPPAGAAAVAAARAGAPRGRPAAGGAGGGGPDRLQVGRSVPGRDVAAGHQVTFKILNPESVAKQWSDIKVRYYFTPTVQLAPMVTFDYVAEVHRGHADDHRHDRVRRDRLRDGRRDAWRRSTTSPAATRSSSASPTTRRRPGTRRRTDDYSYKSCAGGANTRRTSTGRRCPATTRGSSRGGPRPTAVISGRRTRRPGRAPAFPVGRFRVRVSPPARRRFSLRPRMAMTYRLFAPARALRSRLRRLLAACGLASPPPPAPGAPAAPAAAAAPPASAAPAAPAVVGAAADWNAPPTNGSPGVDVPKLSGNELLEQHRLRGRQVRPVDDVVHGARRRQRLRQGRSVLHRRHQQGQ